MTFEVKNGNFSYGKRQILKNISFKVKSGEVLCVLGPNGVGKTTLLRCMMGLLKWNSGKTFVDEKPMLEYTQKELWQKIAYVPQAKNSAFGFTAFDMVLLGRSSHLGTFSQPDENDKKIAIKAMEETGILWLKDKLCTEMSGGELQMVLIARALAVNPQMLVFDEPESNLDFKNQLIILNTISHLAKEHNISAIVNTHYPAHAMKIADKALILNRNGESLYGGIDEVINEENLRKTFSVQVHINDFLFQQKKYHNVVPLYLV